MTETKSHILDAEKTIPHFLNYNGSAFTKKIDFSKGVFFAKLPQEISGDQLFDFKKNINSLQTKNDAVCEEYDLEQQDAMNWECSHFIDEFLDEKDENCAIIDNGQSAFHHFLKKNTSVEEIHQTITSDGNGLHFLAVLTELKNGAALENSTIEEICENANFVLLSAYNGDGYIVWQRLRPKPKFEIIEREVHRHSLEIEKTLPYFAGHIKCDKALAKKAYEKIDFTKGSFFTILPNEALLDRLFNFEWSIIPTAPKKKLFVASLSKTFVAAPVSTMKQETTQFIADFLAESPQNWAVMEDYLAETTSPSASIGNVKMIPYHSEIYYILNRDNSLEEIYRALKQSKQLWRSLTILTRLKEPPSDLLTDAILDEICENAQFVITDAYDGEGDIFWQRKKD